MPSGRCLWYPSVRIVTGPRPRRLAEAARAVPMSSSTPEASASRCCSGAPGRRGSGVARASSQSEPDDAPRRCTCWASSLARTGRATRRWRSSTVRSSARRATPGFLNNRALVLSESGRLDGRGARPAPRRCRLEPRFYAGLVHLGSVLRRAGRLEEATAAFRRALSVDARAPDAHVGLGNVLRERGDARRRARRVRGRARARSRPRGRELQPRQPAARRGRAGGGRERRSARRSRAIPGMRWR